MKNTDESRKRMVDENVTYLDVADELAGYYATQAITQAQGRMQGGNTPTGFDERHLHEIREHLHGDL